MSERQSLELQARVENLELKFQSAERRISSLENLVQGLEVRLRKVENQ
jgi:hypothetical protein